MRLGNKITVVVAGTVVFAGIGGASGMTAGVGDGPSPGAGEASTAKDDDLSRAREVALDVTGGGRVTDTEIGDEESWYEIEVTLPDGRRVDVQLDESFELVGTLPDVGETPGD